MRDGFRERELEQRGIAPVTVDNDGIGTVTITMPVDRFDRLYGPVALTDATFPPRHGRRRVRR